MTQLLGEYEVKVDSKGRIRIPSDLLSQMGEDAELGFVINRGFENNLMLYPKKVWDKITEDVNALNPYDRKNQKFIRFFYRAQEVKKDSTDRVLIGKRFLGYANISSNMILFAYNDKVELWDPETYEEKMNEGPEDIWDIAADVMGNNNRI